MMRIYSKSPAGAAQAPGIVVIMHGPGLDKFIEDRVDDLAHHGYAAAAPDLYHRQPEDGADMMARIGRLRDKEIIADADATIAHLRALKDVRVTDLESQAPDRVDSRVHAGHDGEPACGRSR